MGLLDNLFGKKGKSSASKAGSITPSPSPQKLPPMQPAPPIPSPISAAPQPSYGLADETRWVNYAMSLFSQGYGEAEVRSALLSNGLDANEIDRIMTKVMRQVVTSRDSYSPAEYSAPQPFSGEDEGVFDLTPMRSGNEENVSGGSEYYEDYDEDLSFMEEVSSLIESTINEKLEVVNDRMEEIMSRLENLERNLNALSSKFEETVKTLEEKDREIENELNDLKDKLAKFDPRVKSLEDAFKDIVPNLVDNVREVRELVMEIKHKEEVKKHRKLREI